MRDLFSTVLLDGLEEVGQVGGGLDLGHELVQLGVFVGSWINTMFFQWLMGKKSTFSTHFCTLSQLYTI